MSAHARVADALDGIGAHALPNASASVGAQHARLSRIELPVQYRDLPVPALTGTGTRASCTDRHIGNHRDS